MPDMWTHVLCGTETFDKLDGDSFRDVIQREMGLFKLGTLGGDIFYFYNFWPWLPSSNVRNIAKLLHTQKTGEFFIYALEYLKNQEFGKKSYDELFAYIAGFMCHYALDRTAHPYIYYFAGKYDKSNPETYRLKGYHKGLEAAIDTVLLYEKRGILSYKYPAHKEIQLGKPVSQAVLDFYESALKNLFGMDINGKYVEGAYNDMVRALKILHDPAGIKANLLGIIEKVIAHRLEYSSIVYQNIDRRLDYLNTKCSQWNHPCDREEVYNSSFYELFDTGISEGLKMIKNSSEYLIGKIKKAEMKAVFPDLSYLTGKSIYEVNEIKYFNPIFG